MSNWMANDMAFPVLDREQTPNGTYQLGLTKREWFAAMADQPGVAEIVAAAGLHCRDGHAVWKDNLTSLGTFNQWWGTLANDERFRLVAKVRVQYADAMLAELSK